ncbi:phosphotransferase family protein [Robbsia andropogonis]|uniref:phosphotransferase family protein n=1 Tax=Robbsia andropogonis TaxID=28092 RepID=UPI000466EFFA|nr:aminoglycoside phosphotransferase family protein [Robbsia andropogonis]
MESQTVESKRLLDALLAAGISSAVTVRAGTAGIASPMRVATEWAGFWVTSESRHYYAKVLYEDMMPVVSADKTARATECAARTGATPDVKLIDARRSVLLFDALPAPEWHSARVDDLNSRDRLDALWNLKRKVHQGPTPDFVRSPFDDLHRIRDLCNTARVSLPIDAAWIDECVDLATAALKMAPGRSVPIHGDGVASNVMIGPNDELRLIDFDTAGVFDEWYDVATTLNELYQFEDEWRTGIAAWAGHCAEVDYARCRLYALLDDWLWTLSATWSGATSSRQLEFTKLGQWTLLRCRQTIQDARFESWLRQLKKAAS